MPSTCPLSLICPFFTPGWLEALLDRVARDPHTVVTPDIDVINDDTFEYSFSKEISQVGVFDWSLQVRGTACGRRSIAVAGFRIWV